MVNGKTHLAFCHPARMGLATERTFSWIQTRFIRPMSHAQHRRGEHGDYVDTSEVITERSCRREGQSPLAFWVLACSRLWCLYATILPIVSVWPFWVLWESLWISRCAG